MMMKTILALSMAMALGGCAGLQSDAPPDAIYSLRPAAATGEIETGPVKILEIAPPAVPPGMDRDRIALYTNDGQRLDYFASAVWSSDLGDVLQNFTRRSAMTILPYVVAVTPDQSIAPNYRLQVKLNEFEPVYQGNLDQIPNLKVEAEFTLVALPHETMISSFTLSRNGAAQDNRLDSITAGLEGMLQDIEHEAFLKIDPLMRGKNAK